MPTKHRRHAITETPRVKAALDAVRAHTGQDRVELAELVVLGAEAKLVELRATGAAEAAARAVLADMIRRRDIPGDVEAANEVRRTGWARPVP